MADLILDDLVMRRPADGQGVEIWPAFSFDHDEVDSYSSLDTGWRFALESAVPLEGAAVWDTSTWDESEWSENEWADLTPDARWIQIDRGGSADALARSDIGVMNFQIANRHGRYSIDSSDPYTSPLYHGAGTVVRAGLFQAADDIETLDDWYPLMTGFTESWQERHSGGNPQGIADAWVDVTAVETISWLQRVDEFAVSPVGAGDTAWQRIDRLLDGVFPLSYAGYLDPEVNGATFQATTMAGPRLTELYLLADSLDADLRATKQGRLVLVDKGYGGLTFRGRYLVLSELHGHDYPNFHISYDADSFEPANDDAIITNVVNLACVGGTELNFENTPSIERFQRRSYSRNDLIYETSIQSDMADWISSRMLARGVISDRPAFASVNGRRSLDHLITCGNLDLSYILRVQRPVFENGVRTKGVFYEGVSVAGLTHTIELFDDGHFSWNTDIEFGVSNEFNKAETE